MISDPQLLVRQLDAQTAWRAALDRQLAALAAALGSQELIEPGEAAALQALRERLAADRLVLAFVAEFSRGKSELINALLFASAGRRVLPATPGRTTMCPVELRWDPALPPRLSLLPIETRRDPATLAELRQRCSEPAGAGPDPWQHRPLAGADADMLAQALQAVAEVRRVSPDEAAALGLAPPPGESLAAAGDGLVEVPAWRHAVVNHPHPLLERGLVVIDTPGLNAVGAEPELTLGLLPSAHALVFVLAADAGVTRSDLALWREHLAAQGVERFVVLNKADTLADPLAPPGEVAAQLRRQCEQAAQWLDLPASQVWPLSAREALAARIGGDTARLTASGLPPFEQALAERLLPRRHERLAAGAEQAVDRLRVVAQQRLADRRRQFAEQLFELRGLRGKSGGKLRLMAARVDAEAAEFEQCTARLAALRAVQSRLLRSMLAPLSSDALRLEVAAMQSAIGARPLALGGRAAFDALIGRLRAALVAASAQATEMRQMLEASFASLNADFGFAFAVMPPPAMAAFDAELGRIADGYGRYFGLTQSWRLATPGFAESFCRMLLSKLRVVFESAASELEQWSRGAATQLAAQRRERRRAFARRREALERVQSAAGELDQRIADLEAQDERLATLAAQVDAQADAVFAAARAFAAPPPPAAAAA